MFSCKVHDPTLFFSNHSLSNDEELDNFSSFMRSRMRHQDIIFPDLHTYSRQNHINNNIFFLPFDGFYTMNSSVTVCCAFIHSRINHQAFNVNFAHSLPRFTSHYFYPRLDIQEKKKASSYYLFTPLMHFTISQRAFYVTSTHS